MQTQSKILENLREALVQRKFEMIDRGVNEQELISASVFKNPNFSVNPIRVWILLNLQDEIIIKICDITGSLPKKSFNAIMRTHMQHFDSTPEGGVIKKIYAGSEAFCDVGEIANRIVNAYSNAVTAE
jgi:hypothetical protein